MLQHDWFFSSWDEDVYVPVDEESENALPVSGMNRELLSKAEDMGTSLVQRGHATSGDPFYTIDILYLIHQAVFIIDIALQYGRDQLVECEENTLCKGSHFTVMLC